MTAYRRPGPERASQAEDAGGGIDLAVCDPWTIVFHLTDSGIERIFGPNRRANCTIEYSADRSNWLEHSSELIDLRPGSTYLRLGIQDCWIRVRLSRPAGGSVEQTLTSAGVRVPRVTAAGMALPDAGELSQVRGRRLQPAPPVPRVIEIPPERHRTTSGEFFRRRFVVERPYSLGEAAAASGGRLFSGRSGVSRVP